MRILVTSFWLILSVVSFIALILYFGKPIIALLDVFLVSEPKEVSMEKVLVSCHYLQSSNGYHLFRTQLDESNGQISIDVEGEPFVFGTIKDFEEWRSGKDYSMILPPGDKITLNVCHSIFSWYTLELSIISNRPSRKRFAYFELQWTKADGTILKASWKCEQGKYRRYWTKGESKTYNHRFSIKHPKEVHS